MTRFTVFSIAFLFLAGIVSAATNVGEYVPLPVPTDQGGPDAYGYSWEDNDGGGAPDYQWVDITQNGVLVEGLLDDNNVGPFAIGFDFAYYWYTVDTLRIGSNGYVTFFSRANFAHPFSDLPSSGQPNNLVAVLGGDLDFTRGGQCYYYTNNVDSFVVSWIDVPQFSPDGSLDDSTHTLQLILTAADSTLTFQYGENHGNFGEGGQLADVIGMEDIAGRVGLQYLRNNAPSNHMWHDRLVIKFHPEPDPNFIFHDFGMVDGFIEGSGAQLIPINQPFIVRANGLNVGNVAEDNLRIRCQIRLGTNTVFTDTVEISHLEPLESQWVEFDPFTPAQVATYRVTFTAIMSNDQYPADNTKICEMDSYELPQELRYCDDTGDAGRSWNGDYSGFGVEFQVPQAIEVTRASFNVFSSTTAGPAYIWIIPDDGNGNPDVDNILAGDTLQVTSAGWKDVDFSWAGLTFAPNERFYVVALHALQLTFEFAMDQTTPLSYRGWEYTGGLAPDRDRELSDVMFKVMAQPGLGTDDIELTPKSFSISQNYPNPFNASTNISFSIDHASDVKIGIYNVAGQKVADLSSRFNAGENIVTWDASTVASGVYFYRILFDGKTETRKMVLLK